MRGKGEGQPQHCCQLRAEAARPEESYGNAAPLAGNGFDSLSRLFRAQIGPQFLGLFSGKSSPSTQIPPESAHVCGNRRLARPTAKIDSCRIKCLEVPTRSANTRSGLATHAAAAYANCPGRYGYVPISTGVAEHAKPGDEVDAREPEIGDSPTLWRAGRGRWIAQLYAPPAGPRSAYLQGPANETGKLMDN